MLENEKQNRDANRGAEVKQGAREAIDLSNSGLHHKVASSGQERYDPSCLQQIVQNNIFCGNNRENNSKSVSKVVQR